MYAITGITGQIGGVVGRLLLEAGQPVRAVVRNAGKGREWADRGCEVALATIEDAASLTAAFQGAQAVFVLVPPNFDPLPDFPEARAIGVALRSALEAARPARVVYLSTIGGTGKPAQSSYPAHDHRGGDHGRANAACCASSGLVHGELQLGCSSGTGAGCDSEFSSTARQTDTDGGDGGHREGGNRNSSRAVARSPRGRVGRTEARHTKRGCHNFRQALGQFGADGSCAARILGGRFQIAGDEKPNATDSNAGWV